MKKMKKVLSLILTVIMVLAMAVPSFAEPQQIQEVDSLEEGSASITIMNALKDETYAVHKLFDAEYANGSIVYKGTVPEGLGSYFEADENGYISLEEGITEETLFSALKDWADTRGLVNATVSAISDGRVLKFTNLQYGYYVVTTTQGSAVTVDSTNPNAEIYDKNNSEPGTPEKDSNVEEATGVAIGDTIEYTVKFDTTNYIGEGEDAKQITSYTITDTLPDFLENVEVSEITIGGVSYEVWDSEKEDYVTPQFDEESKSITISWVDEDGNSIYDNGVEVVVKYTAKLTKNATIAGNGNVNTVTISWEDEDGGEGQKEDTEVIYTYALAIKKVDQNGNALAGATFSIAGISVEKQSDGYYIVTGPGSTSGPMECDKDGILIVEGVKAGTDYTVTEESAPEGYNKLDTSFTVTPQKISEEVITTITYYTEEGEISSESTEIVDVDTTASLLTTAREVENKAGLELPSTGGIGTTIFYAAGIVLMAGAVFFVVRRKRA